jgi:hypothetical protein
MQSSDSLETTDIVQLDGFRELHRGSWCGKTLDEIGPDLMARFDACDELTHYERTKYFQPYGTTTARLSGVSQYSFGHCALSLHPYLLTKTQERFRATQ